MLVPFIPNGTPSKIVIFLGCMYTLWVADTLIEYLVAFALAFIGGLIADEIDYK